LAQFKIGTYHLSRSEIGAAKIGSSQVYTIEIGVS